MDVQVEVVREVTQEVVDALGRLLPQLSRTAPPPGREQVAGVVECPTNALLLARGDGATVGMLTLVMFPIPSGLRARIEDVVVDERARGQGIGAALTLAAVELARRRGARTVDLASRPSRVAANRLYQRLGFELRDTQVYRFTEPPG
jgi:ribosomal protein S18 acetylase RimI-like enzyme